MSDSNWPALPLEAWRQTRDTLHLYLQIVGKIRLALSPLALYRYDDMRSAADPRAALLEFFGSACLAGASAARWDVETLEKR